MRRKYKQAKAGHVARWVGDWLEDPTLSFLPLQTSALSLPFAFQRHQSPVTQMKEKTQGNQEERGTHKKKIQMKKPNKRRTDNRGNQMQNY